MLQLGDLLQRGQCLQKAGVLLVKVGACGEFAREQILRMLVVLPEDGRLGGEAVPAVSAASCSPAACRERACRCLW